MTKVKIVSLVVAAGVAVGAYFTGVPVMDAVKIALSNDAAKAACVKLLEEQPIVSQ